MGAACKHMVGVVVESALHMVVEMGEVGVVLYKPGVEVVVALYKVVVTVVEVNELEEVGSLQVAAAAVMSKCTLEVVVGVNLVVEVVVNYSGRG